MQKLVGRNLYLVTTLLFQTTHLLEIPEYLYPNLSFFVGNKVSTTLLTEDNFESLVKESYDMWLIAFVDPNCNTCGKDIKPEWDRTSMRLSGKVKMGKVFSKKMARRFGVNTFPTIGYFPKGEKNYFDIYTGDITANKIVPWALRRLQRVTNTGKLKDNL